MPKPKKKRTKKIHKPGEEASYLSGDIKSKIQSRLDNLGVDPQMELAGMPKKKRKSLALLYSDIREIQQLLKETMKDKLFHGRNPVEMTPFVMCPHEILQVDNLNSTAKLVWLVLYRHTSDKEVTCFPSQSRIATELSKSVRSIQRALDQLIGGGYIIADLRKVGGKQFFNEYTFNLNLDKLLSRRKK